MLVIEGPDLVGKTTLCKGLLALLHADGKPHVYQHLSRLPPAFKLCEHYLPLISRYKVQDRFHWSQQAYGAALGDRKISTPFELQVINGALARVGGFTVVITASQQALRSAYAARGQRQEMYGIEQIVEVNAQYKLLTKMAGVDLQLEVDLNKHWPSHSAELIAKLYSNRQEELDAL